MSWSHKGSNPNRGIARRRRMLGLTQHQLSQETGIAVGRIVFAETDRIVLEPHELDRIRSAFRRRLREVRAEVA